MQDICRSWIPPPHIWQSLTIEDEKALDLRIGIPGSFVQRVGCFRFQSAHSKHSFTLHFAAGTKKACRELELPCFSRCHTKPWQESQLTAVVSNCREAACAD